MLIIVLAYSDACLAVSSSVCSKLTHLAVLGVLFDLYYDIAPFDR